MIEQFQLRYTGSRMLAARSGLIVFTAMENWERITAVKVSLLAENVESGSRLFNIRQNGVNLFTNELTIDAGDASVTADELEIDVVPGDEFIFDYKTPNQRLTPPLFLELTVETSVELSTADVDDSTDKRYVTDAQLAKIVALPSTFLDTEGVQDIVGAMFQTGSRISFNYNDATGKLELDALTLSDEEVQDKVAALLSAGSNVTINYNDGANTLTISSATRTDEEIQDIVAALLQQGSNVTLTYNDAGNTLTIAASGGGGSSNNFSYFHPDAPYASPNAKDDDFTGSSLDAKWTRHASGENPTLAFNAPHSFLSIDSNGYSGNNFFYYQAAPAGAFKFRAKIVNNGEVSQNMIGIGIQHASGFAFLYFLGNQQVNRITGSALNGLSGTNFATMPTGVRQLWIEIERTASALLGRYSLDGIHFSAATSFGNLTPTQIGFAGGGSTGNKMLIDWFRIVDASNYTGRQISI